MGTDPNCEHAVDGALHGDGLAEEVDRDGGYGLTGRGRHRMVSHMKTTIDIADQLLQTAKARAAKEGRTLKDVVEQALRRYLQDGRPTARKFKLRCRPFKGKGTQPGVTEGRWEQVRDLIYPM